MADKRDLIVNLIGKETVSTAAGKAEKGLDKLGDEFRATSADAKILDGQIGEVEDALKALAVQYARTGDAGERLDISKQIRKQETDLRKLSKARGHLGDPDNDGLRFAERIGGVITQKLSRLGEPFGSALSASFGSMPPQAQAAIGAAVAGMVAATAPVAGAALAGAIVGGAGAGGVAGGLLIAAKDARVKAAASGLGDELGDMFEHAAKPFVPATLEALGIVRKEFRRLEPEFGRIFESASKYVEPLTRGVMGLVREALPGIRKAVEGSGPFFDMLGDKLPGLGEDIGGLFATAARYADEGASALGLMVEGGRFFVRALEGAVIVLSETYGLGMKIADLFGLGGNEKKFTRFKESADETKPSVLKLGDAAQKMKDRTDILTGSLRNAIDAAGGFKQALDIATGSAVNAEQAEINWQRSIDNVAAALRENGPTLDKDTEAGRRNREMLLKLAEDGKTRAQSIYDQTAATKGQPAAEAAAQAAMAVTRQRLIDSYLQFDNNIGRAKAYADAILGIPKTWGTTVRFDGKSALDNIELIKRRIAEIKTRVDIYAVTHNQTSYGGSAHTGQGYGPGIADGGPIYGPGPKGVDSVPVVLAPGEHVLTAREVDAAGGHSAIEGWRKSLLSRTPAPAMAGASRGGGGGGGGGGPTVIEIRSGGSALDDLLVEILRGAVKQRGGNVQLVLGRG